MALWFALLLGLTLGNARPVVYFASRPASPTTDEFVEGGSATAMVGVGAEAGTVEDTSGLFDNRTRISSIARVDRRPSSSASLRSPGFRLSNTLRLFIRLCNCIRATGSTLSSSLSSNNHVCPVDGIYRAQTLSEEHAPARPSKVLDTFAFIKDLTDGAL